ncbi:hypothetical protein L7F22_053792 [Adiantum nelumboides]|nr:hypothetical protein [Adiantum nelumboides]
MCHHSLEADTTLGNSLVSLLVDVGSVHDARWVFNVLPVRHESSWNFLISGYSKAEEPDCALTLYDHMQNDKTLHPCGTTYAAALKACTQLKTLQKGRQIHAQVASLGLLEMDSFVGSTLLDMYAKCGFIAKAQQVFDDLPICNVVSWTALIGGYVEHGEGEEALRCFQVMQDKGISPNRITFICTLKACAMTGDVSKGQEVHAEVARQGLSGKDIVVGNSLVYMYAKFGMLVSAQEVFDRLPMQNIVSWTSIISGYAEDGKDEEAINCFEEMQIKGIFPNAITLGCVMKACSSLRFISKGQDIHAEIERKGLLQTNDIALGNALIDMYATCGQLKKAQEVFTNIPAPNVITWTTLISGYAENGYAEEALKAFELMETKGALPNSITLIYGLKACGSIKAVGKGRDIQVEIERQGLLERDSLAANALIDMYVKCGLLSIAQEVFDKLSVRDVISWNILISGYSEHGYGKEALQHSEQMQLEGAVADDVTLVSRFKACGLAGATCKVNMVLKQQMQVDKLIIANSSETSEDEVKDKSATFKHKLEESILDNLVKGI